MRNSILTIVSAILVIVILSSFWKQDKITLWMMGDSTMSIKEPKAYPEMGWGVAFSAFWNTSIKVENHAKNGRSTKTFIEEKRWNAIETSMKAGDYLFIQFGHNDEVPTKKSYTDPNSFETNLNLFIRTAKSKKVTSILITPVSRRSFDSLGVFYPTHEEYSPIVRKVAKENEVVLIDLDILSQNLIKELGPSESKHLFLHLKEGEHPNYPQGKTDDTHLNEYGARLIAQLVLKEIKIKLPELYKRVNQY